MKGKVGVVILHSWFDYCEAKTLRYAINGGSTDEFKDCAENFGI